MDKILVVAETDVKRWVKEAVTECLVNQGGGGTGVTVEEELLDRQKAAELLRISLVTLSDWTKKGLPHYRKNRRIFYKRSEVLLYMQTNSPDKINFSDKYVALPSK